MTTLSDLTAEFDQISAHINELGLGNEFFGGSLGKLPFLYDATNALLVLDESAVYELFSDLICGVYDDSGRLVHRLQPEAYTNPKFMSWINATARRFLKHEHARLQALLGSFKKEYL